MTVDRSRLDALSPAERRRLLAKLLREKLDRPQLSFAQERLWFLHQLVPETSVYNVPAAVELSGDLDVAALESSLAEIVRRHEVLRTVFEHRPQGPVPRIEDLSLTLEREDLSGVPAGERRERALERANEVAGEPLDPETGPLVRAVLLQLDDEEHLLLVVLHHLVAEVWSLAVLFEELEALYAAFAAGEPSPLEPLPMQYAAYARWQREHFRGEILEREIDYWREQLGGELPVLELPSDRSRPAVQTFAGGWRERRLSPELSAGLERLAQRRGATLFMTLLAGYQALLARYTGQTDILVGSPVAARSRQEAERLIGLFINTLVLRSDLGGDPTFSELVERVRRVAVGAFSHQEVPFEQVVETLAPDRRLSHTPIFQVMFALQNTPRPELDLEGLGRGRMLGPDEIHNAGTKVDLALFVEHDGEALELGCEYSSDLFDGETIDRLLEHLEVLFEAAVADPDCRLSRLPLMSDAERRRVVVDWNRTTTDAPLDTPVHELVARHAEATPDAVALSQGDRTLTYRQLDRQANRMARFLRRCGVRDESRVAVRAERSPELVVALLAILKAGGAYVPIDPGYPAERARLMLDDAGADLLLTQGSIADTFGMVASRATTVIRLDRDSHQWNDEPEDDPLWPVETDALAYVMYTSGSTGRPKGTAIPHRGVVRLVQKTNYAELGSDQVFLQLAPISFDASTFEIWGALTQGARLDLFPPRVPSLDDLAEHIETHGITTLWLTASLFHRMARRHPEALGRLRQLLAGGDVLDPQPVERIARRLAAGRMINGYGPTENTTFTCCHRIEAGEDLSSGVPIGRAIANTRVYVLDHHLEPVPIGIPGELYTGGDGLARGYVGQVELTAELFVPDPFGAPGERLYRSGDLARYRPDGTLEFLGRLDHQVKVRGYRVEPGELEVALRSHPEVTEAAVIADDDPGGEKRLIAYVVSLVPDPPTPSELRAFVARTLPDFMLPAAIIPLDEVLYTQSGKIDRAALPRPTERPLPDDSFVPPETDIQKTVSRIWRDALDLEQIGVEDRFFEIGGHSLMLVTVSGRLQEEFGITVPMVELFRHPTVAALSDYLAERLESGELAPAVPRPREGVREATGGPQLSFAQERLWFLHQLVPETSVYNVPAAVELSGDLDVAALESSLAEIVRRHEVLRTVFEHRPQGPVPRIEDLSLTLEREDLSGVPAGERRERALECANEVAGEPLDPETGPLVRAVLFQLDHEEHLLLVVLHHLVAEVWSLAVLFEELEALYAAFAAGEPSPLEPLPMQYAAYARWQREHFRGEILEREIDYWREQLGGELPVLELPSDRSRPAVQTFAGGWRERRLSPELSAGLERLAQRRGATLFMTLLAGYQALLARYTGQTDILVGSPVAARSRQEAERLIGLFINTLVLRSDLGGDPTFSELVERVRRVAVGAFSHQEVPFEQVVETLAPDRRLSHTPIFQVMFALQNTPRPELDLEGLGRGRMLGPDEIHNAGTKVDLALFVEHDGEALELGCEYSSDLFDGETIDRLLEHLEVLFEAAVADPDCRLSRLPLMSDAERRRVVVDWNRTTTDAPPDTPVHELVTRHAEATPDAVALSQGDRTLTYRQLDRQANRMARFLRRGGIGPGHCVAQLTAASLEAVVAQLAILRAGAAYLSIDPKYPTERIAFMLEDSGSSLLLTREALKKRISGVTPAPIAYLDSAEAPWHREEPAGLDLPVRPDDSAYVIYTSGSTGRPKGVEVPHRGLANLAAWHRDAYALTARDRCTQLASLAFDASVWEIWSALTAGSTLLIVDDETRLSPDAILDFLTDNRISCAFVPTPHAEMLVEMEWPEESVLRHLLTGGSRLHRRPAESRPFRLINHYGPTENSVVTTATEIAPGDDASLPPIGRPISGHHVYILDQGLEPAPIGVPGEIYVAGVGVAHGYRSRPQLTAERFLPNPFGPAPGTRLYRTGDFGRWRLDGQIDFLGRRDHQVQVRGFRVELEEIEGLLLEHSEIREATVVHEAADARHGVLTAYLVTRPGSEVATDELRRFVRRRLPDYMVPGLFVELQAMPLTSSGKVDRDALRQAPHVEARSPAPIPGSLTPLEEAILAVWKEVLPTSSIGLDDSFFELGGHSLMLVEVHTRLRERIDSEITIVDLFRYPTISSLVAHCERAATAPR